MNENYQRNWKRFGKKRGKAAHPASSQLLRAVQQPGFGVFIGHFRITVFFYNPNISPREEFEKKSAGADPPDRGKCR